MERKKLAHRVIEHIIQSKPLDFADLNVNAIARRFKVSVPHLSRVFKAEYGTCLNKFILMEKITRTRFLLKQNMSLKVKDIASALDFCSTDYFIRIFKKQVGLTPGKYRKLNGTFYGLRDRRKGLSDRRSEIKERRKILFNDPVKSIKVIQRKNNDGSNKNRRQGPEDRRKGPPDRRQLLPRLFDLTKF